jgi:hypothetical protein
MVRSWRAREHFDVFLTVDQNVQFQQNLSALPLPMVVLVTPDNRLSTLAPLASTVLRLLALPLARELVRIEGPDRIIRVPARAIQP